METLVPIATLLLGAGLSEASQFWREHRSRSHRREERRDEFLGTVLADAMLAIDRAYEAASEIGLNADQLGVNGVETDSEWKVREPYVKACGSASFNLRRVAAALPPQENPRVRIEEFAQATADLTGEGTTKELLERWKLIDPSVIAAREAVGRALRGLYAPER